MKKRHTLLARSFYGHRFTFGVLIATLSLAQAHAASTSHYTFLPGDELDLSAPCGDVHIYVDPSLKRGLSLEDTPNKKTTINTAADGAEQTVHVFSPSCEQKAPLSLRLAPGTALTLHDSPHANITILGTLSTLESTLTDALLQVDHVQSLDLSIHGTSSVHIHQLDRAAELLASEHASLSIDKAFLSALSAHMSDSSQLTISEGQIDTLALVMSGKSNASIMAQIGSASTSTRDDVELTLGHITENLVQSGNGHIHQASSSDKPVSTPSTTPPSPPSRITDGSAQGLNSPQPLPTQGKTPSPSIAPIKKPPSSANSSSPLTP